MDHYNSQITKSSTQLQRILWFSLIFLPIITFWSCAPHQPVRNRDAALPEIDVLQLKENSDIALRLVQECRLSIDDLSTRVGILERTVADLTASVQTLPLAQLEEAHSQITVLREELYMLREAVETQGAAIPTFNPAHKAPMPTKIPPAPEEYRLAMAQFQQKEWSKAIALFDQMVVKYPESSWADDAWYWIGESYAFLGDYARAIEAIHNVINFDSTH